MQERRGLGKAKHIDTQYLRCQDMIGSGKVSLVKIPGERNTADLMAKHLTGPKMLEHMDRFGHHLVSSDPVPVPELAGPIRSEAPSGDLAAPKASLTKT